VATTGVSGRSGCPVGVRWGTLRRMGDAAKVIDWNGIDVPAGVGELLAKLPPGRYRIAVVPEENDGFELTPELEAKVEAGIADIRAGRTVPWATVKAELDARIGAHRTR
jgi:hypothetical protein